MISKASITGSPEELILFNPTFQFEKDMYVLRRALAPYKANYEAALKEYEMYAMFESEGDKSGGFKKAEANLEQRKKSFVTKLGDTIIKIIEKLVESLKKIVEKIKSNDFETKTNIEKTEELMKKHPDLKNEIVTAFKEGDLNVKDVKDLAELEKNFEECMKSCDKENPDIPEINKKWNAAIEKFENAEKHPIVTTAKAATTVLGVVTAVLAVQKACRERESYINGNAQKMYNFCKANNTVSDKTGVNETKARLAMGMAGKLNALAGDNLSMFDKLRLNSAKVLDTISAGLPGGLESRDRYHQSMNVGSQLNGINKSNNTKKP